MARSTLTFAALLAVLGAVNAEILVLEPTLNVYDGAGVHVQTVGAASGADLDENSAGDIFVVSGAGAVTVLDSGYSPIGSWSAGGSVYGMCIGGSPQTAFFAHSSNPNVREYDLTGVFLRNYLTAGGSNLRDSAIASNGDLWVSNFSQGGVMNRFAYAGAELSAVSAGPITTPFGVSVAPNGDLWVINQNSPHSVMRYDTTGMLITNWNPSMPIGGQVRDGLAATPNDELLIGGYSEPVVRLYDSGGALLSSFTLMTGNAIAIRWKGGAGAGGPTCMITAPAAGATVSGEVALDFDADDPGAAPLDSAFEFSTDAGATWNPATAAATSALANPDLGRAVPFTATFTWDSAADAVGGAGAQAADLRVSLSTAMGGSGSCSVMGLLVDNSPTCSITSPAPMATMLFPQDIVFDADHPTGASLGSTFDFSTDGGTTWAPATASAASPVANPDPPRATPWSGLTFGWDAAVDITVPPASGEAQLRITVDDGGPGTGSCEVTLTIDCVLCGDCNVDGLGPNVIDALSAAQLAAGLAIPTPTQQLCCDTDGSTTITVLDALGIAQEAAGLMPGLACP